MKNSVIKITLIVLSTILFISCRNEPKKQKEVQSQPVVVVEQKLEKKVDEFKLLADYLKENGDFINSPYCPSMIGAEEVYKNMDNPAYLIIDIRKPEHYAEGHIKNAKNVGYFKVLDYFKNNVNPDNYEKIVLVCYSGQSASYLTSLLQMLGYDNVYAMKFGMSSWNIKMPSLIG